MKVIRVLSGLPEQYKYNRTHDQLSKPYMDLSSLKQVDGGSHTSLLMPTISPAENG